MKILFASLFFLSLIQPLAAQQYTLNGSAIKTNCHCYILTENINDRSGSVWNNNKIDLTNSFDFVFTVNLGGNTFSRNGQDGADGIVFVLQPISTSVGTTGGGLGFGGVSPSIGITLDTWQNVSPDNDPAYDHIAIQRNGDLNHLSANNLAGPVPISPTDDNIEDSLDHTLRIKWNAATKTLETYFDEVFRTSIVNDIVNTTFGGNPLVFWGFTGSTGGSNNTQSFCTALAPHWKLNALQKRCFGEPITFYDSTFSFTSIVKFYWNFGDGSDIDSVHLNPVHTYAIPGDYIMTQKVIGADGCEEINTQTVRIGSKPVAAFKVQDTCIGQLVLFTDTSKTAVGTINSWYWGLDDGGPAATLKDPATTYTGYGIKNIKLAVKSIEGCVSDTLVKTVRIRALPVVDLSFTDSVCLGTKVTFTDKSTLADGPVNGWTWVIDGAALPDDMPVIDHLFTTPGNHTVRLYATATTYMACEGTPVTKNVFIADKPRAAIKAITLCQLQQVQLQDSSYTTDGIKITGWWWDLGNGQFSTLQNPIVNYTTAAPIKIKHVVYNSRGCTSDTSMLSIIVHAKPVAAFGTGAALCNNVSLQFFDSSKTAEGSISQWEWTYNAAIFSTKQNAANIFPPGSNTVGLTVTTDAGCKSDRATRSFIIKTKPEVSVNYKDACKLTPVNFSAMETTTGIGITAWHWDLGDGTTAAGNTVTHTYSANKVYELKVYGISTEGCTSDTLKGKVNIYGTNAFAGNDTIAGAGQPVQLHANGGLSYLWLAGAQFLNNSGIADPVATLNATQTFRLKAYTPEGCESYDEVTVKIYKGPDVYLPNAFTPNGDGLNDIFKGIPVGIKQLNFMRIYDRWGQLLFSTSTPNDGWNGRFKGTDQPAGVYIVVVSATDHLGKPVEKKQTVQLIR